MKKTIFLAILITALAVALATSGIRPARAYTYSHSWIGQSHYDPFWGWTITAFEESSAAILTVTVYNSYWFEDLNISTVEVGMDWGTNYSSTEASETSPVVITQYNRYHTFTITFTVPSTSVASNLFSHYYTIYVYEVNATSGPQEENLHDSDVYSGFYVYSRDQKDGMILRDQISLLTGIYETYPWYYPGGIGSVNARSLWENHTVQSDMGDHDYDAGHFGNAETHYETALDLLEQAISTELAYDLDQQLYSDSYSRQMDLLYRQQMEANILNTTASANATLIRADAAYALASAAMTQAYAWIVFGIGFIVFGIAAVVWASKKPGP